MRDHYHHECHQWRLHPADPYQRRLYLYRMDEQGQLRFLGGQHSYLWHCHLCQLETAAVQHHPQGWPEMERLAHQGASNGKFKLPVRNHNDYTFIGWMSKDSSAFSEASILTSDTVIYANWKQLQFNITLRMAWMETRSSRAPATAISNCLCASITTTPSSRVEDKGSSAFSKDNILTSDTVIYANWKQLQFNITLKRWIEWTDSLIKGASNGKFQIACAQP